MAEHGGLDDGSVQETLVAIRCDKELNVSMLSHIYRSSDYAIEWKEYMAVPSEEYKDGVDGRIPDLMTSIMSGHGPLATNPDYVDDHNTIIKNRHRKADLLKAFVTSYERMGNSVHKCDKFGI